MCEMGEQFQGPADCRPLSLSTVIRRSTVETCSYKREVLDAMEEARTISRNSETKRYRRFSEAMEDFEAGMLADM